MKRSKVLAILAAGIVLLSGCGSSAAETTIDAAALAETLSTDISYDDELELVEEDDVDMYIDLPDGVISVMYMGSGSTAEEAAVFTAPDEETAKETQESVQSFLDDQMDSFEDYVPEEAKRVGNAVLEQRGNYVILSVSGDPETAKELIEEAFK